MCSIELIWTYLQKEGFDGPPHHFTKYKTKIPITVYTFWGGDMVHSVEKWPKRW